MKTKQRKTNKNVEFSVPYFLISIFLFLISVIPVFSQSNVWFITPQNPNADNSWGMDVDTSGNIWWATNEVVSPSLYGDIYISKIDSSGQTLWKKKLYSTTYNDIAFIVKIKAPYLFIGGRTETDTSASSADLLLLTCLMQGDTVALQWPYQWNGGVGYEELDGIEMDTSGIYIAGWTTTDTGDAQIDMVVQKLDFNGNVVWNTLWGTPNGFEGANGHLVIDDSAIYIAAHYDNYPGSALLIAFDKSTGNYLWDVKWGGIFYDDFYGLTISSDSFLYAMGPADAFVWLPPVGQLALVKYNRSGQKIWERKWGGTGLESGRAIIADGDSVIYLAAGTYSYGAGVPNIALLKYDSAGNLLDSAIWGAVLKKESVHDIAMFENYLYLVGETDSASQTDAFLLKVDKRTLLFPDTIPDVFTPMNIGAEYLSGNENIDVKFYPNPTNGILQITIGIYPDKVGNERFKNAELKIFDVMGKIVFQKTLNAKREILNLDLPGGIYFLQVKSERRTATQKLIIQK